MQHREQILKKLINKQIDDEEQLIESNFQMANHRNSVEDDNVSESSSVVMTVQDATIEPSLALECIADVYSVEITRLD